MLDALDVEWLARLDAVPDVLVLAEEAAEELAVQVALDAVVLAERLALDVQDALDALLATADAHQLASVAVAVADLIAQLHALQLVQPDAVLDALDAEPLALVNADLIALAVVLVALAVAVLIAHQRALALVK